MRYTPEDHTISFVGPSAAAPRLVGPPNLQWSPVTGIDHFVVRVADADRVVWTSEVTEHRIDLGPAWQRLPLGRVDVLVQGYDAAGTERAVRGHRGFFKAPGWDGSRPAPAEYPAAVRSAMEYLLAPARDTVHDYEAGLPRNVWSCFEDSPTGHRAQLAYPAQHLASFMIAYLQFAHRQPDDALAGEAVRQAGRYGDWLLEHRLPTDWRCGGLPYSTIQRGDFSGGTEGEAITLFRAGRAAEGMVALFDADGDRRYLDYAGAIAEVLVELQSDDGSWPYRVNPRDGAIVEQYASGVVTPMRLFGLLDQRLDAPRFTAARAAAESWLIAGPIATGRWQGQYEDITEQPPWQNLQHWDTNETIRYLLSDHCAAPDRVAMAVALNDYIEDQFVLWQPETTGPVTVRCPTPTVLEQYQCYHPMEVHTGNWLLSLQALHRATGNDDYLAKGIAAANAIVAGQSPDGSLSTWGFDQRFGTPLWTINWPGCHACAVTALLRFTAYLDSLANPHAGASAELGLWGI